MSSNSVAVPVAADRASQWWPAQSKYVAGGRVFVGGGSMLPLLLVWGLIILAQAVVETIDAYPVTASTTDAAYSSIPLTLLMTRFLLPFLAAVLFITAHLDPGVLPRSIPEVSPARNLQAEQPSETDKDGRNYCFTCDLRRPIGGSHCRTCDHCVMGFDHHCIWLNACIGQRNRRNFIILLYTGLGYAFACLCSFARVTWQRYYFSQNDEGATVATYSQQSWTFGELIAASPGVWYSLMALFVCSCFFSMCCRCIKCVKGMRKLPLVASSLLILIQIPNGSALALPLFGLGCSITACFTLGPFAVHNCMLVAREMTQKQHLKRGGFSKSSSTTTTTAAAAGEFYAPARRWGTMSGSKLPGVKYLQVAATEPVTSTDESIKTTEEANLDVAEANNNSMELGLATQRRPISSNPDLASSSSEQDTTDEDAMLLSTSNEQLHQQPHAMRDAGMNRLIHFCCYDAPLPRCVMPNSSLAEYERARKSYHAALYDVQSESLIF